MKKKLGFLIGLTILIILSVVNAMEFDKSEEKNVGVKSFGKPLSQLLVDVYSLPKWNKDGQVEIKQKLLKLGECIYKLSSNKIDLKENIVKISNLGGYSQTIKSMKDFVIDEIQKIYVKDPIFLYVGSIYNDLFQNKIVDEETGKIICDSLSSDITLKQKEEKEDLQHLLTIQNLLPKKLQKNVSNIEKNLLSGANAGFIATTDDKCKYFVKTFSEEALKSSSSLTKKIDSRELFAYKVLEYLGFGPETHYIIQTFSSSKGSKTKGNYIVTKDVTAIDKDEENILIKKEFFRDGDENDSEYEKAMKIKNFAVELFALASLNSILRLRDSFGDNTGNYGIVKTVMKGENVLYEPILIDHLPCTSNAMIDSSYSPGKFLKGKMLDLEKSSSLRSSILAIEKDSKFKSFSSKGNDLTKEVLLKVIRGKKELNFEQSVDQAIKYILSEIEKNSNCFTDETDEKETYFSAKDLLTNHAKRVLENYQMFLKNYH